MGNLFTNGESIRLVELFDLFKESGRLREEGTFCEEVLDVLQAVLLGEAVDIGEELIFWYADKRIADPVDVSGGLRLFNLRGSLTLHQGWL
jgi:hypothetical protein